jgi:glycosyltransferase involved in cell wall biosynthesis
MTDFQVVVVDDGSTDDTPALLEEYARYTPLNLRSIRVKNGGPATARNIAIAALESPVCLMIGDDILASPSLVEKHFALHLQRPALQVGALGLTRWSESGQTVTAFMRWLEEGGIQFSYTDLLKGRQPGWKYFYTSNLSLKTELLRKNPFNESFKKAAAEDLELGFRLERRCGLEIAFLPDAVASHLHPTSFRQACERTYNVASSMTVFYELWPSAAPPGRNSPMRHALRHLMLRASWLLPPLTAVADLVTKAWCPNPLMRAVLRYHGVLGYLASSNSQSTAL